MSIITVVSVPEGIAMAADSRLSGWRKYDNTVERYAISDNFQKIFLLSKTCVGISCCGDVIIGGKTIADVIRLFEIDKINNDDNVETVATKLKELLEQQYIDNSISIYVTGFIQDNPYIYVVGVGNKKCFLERKNILNGNINNSIWFNGDYEAIEKLINGSNPTQIDYNIMPLKDALDLAEFLANTVITYQRFEAKLATCGGPIDLLVITKDYAKFIRHKVLTQ